MDCSAIRGYCLYQRPHEIESQCCKCTRRFAHGDVSLVKSQSMPIAMMRSTHLIPVIALMGRRLSHHGKHPGSWALTARRMTATSLPLRHLQGRIAWFDGSDPHGFERQEMAEHRELGLDA